MVVVYFSPQSPNQAKSAAMCGAFFLSAFGFATLTPSQYGFAIPIKFATAHSAFSFTQPPLFPRNRHFTALQYSSRPAGLRKQSGPVTGSFNGLHLKSNSLAVHEHI
jgi:hypothetical protein